jgi:hypothetical protein
LIKKFTKKSAELETNENKNPSTEQRPLRAARSASTNNLATATRQPLIADKPVRKRKAGANFSADPLAPLPIAASTIIEFDATTASNSTTNKSPTRKPVKLFQMSDSDLTSSNGTNSTAKSESSTHQNPKTVRPASFDFNSNTSETAGGANRMSTRSSRSNLTRETSGNANEASVSATATAIANSANSTYDFPPRNHGPEVVDKLPIKSIMKKTTTGAEQPQARGILTNMQPPPLPAEDAKPKRTVKILSMLNVNKVDPILNNLKCDNKTKHSASTSTPSGLRRRPLKAPVDVSMIDKPE